MKRRRSMSGSLKLSRLTGGETVWLVDFNEIIQKELRHPSGSLPAWRWVKGREHPEQVARPSGSRRRSEATRKQNPSSWRDFIRVMRNTHSFYTKTKVKLEFQQIFSQYDWMLLWLSRSNERTCKLQTESSDSNGMLLPVRKLYVRPRFVFIGNDQTVSDSSWREVQTHSCFHSVCWRPSINETFLWEVWSSSQHWESPNYPACIVSKERLCVEFSLTLHDSESNFTLWHQVETVCFAAFTKTLEKFNKKTMCAGI